MYLLIVFSFVTPNEFVFPKHEQLQSYVQQRGWKSVFREDCIESGWIDTADSLETLLSYFRPRLADGETATIFQFHTATEFVPEFPDKEALFDWATKRSYSRIETQGHPRCPSDESS